MPTGPNQGEDEVGGQSQTVVDIEERSWLPRHGRGDKSAFPSLVQAYRRPVYSYLVRTGVSEAERDDLFQNIFLKVHMAADSYQPARPLRPWIFTIVANTVRNHIRDTGGNEAEVLNDEALVADDPAPGPDRILEARQVVDWLESAVAALPPMQREVLILVTIAGLRQQDAAEALNLPINTVKTHLRRARLSLAQGLSERERAAGDSGDDDELV